jgi:hypothetical protein
VIAIAPFRKKVIACLLLFAFASVLAVFCFSPSANEEISTALMSKNISSTVAPGWNATQLGDVEAVGIGNGVLFNGDFVFWRVASSTDFAITAFNLSSGTFTDVWDSNGSITGGPGDMKVINNTVFASYGYADPFKGLFNTTVIESGDLKSWSQYLFSDTESAESLAEYTGPGPYSGMLEYGGYNGDTSASICAWNSTSSREVDVFEGTFFGSDDACFMAMFNSTCMIAGDCAPSNIIYTNDGGNWTDEYSPDYAPAYTPMYPFVWGWSVYVDNGTAYVAEETSQWQETGPLAPIYQGGVMTWSGVGTTKAFDYGGMIMETISYKLVGGSGGIFDSNGNYGGPSVIYQYNADGSRGPLVWQSGSEGTVKDMIYVPGSGAWYAIAYSDSQSASILKIMQD